MLDWIRRLFRKTKRQMSITTRLMCRSWSRPVLVETVDEALETRPASLEEDEIVLDPWEQARISIESLPGASPPRRVSPLDLKRGGLLPKRPDSPTARQMARVIRLNSSELKEEQMRMALMARHLEDVQRALVARRLLQEYHKEQRLLKLLPHL